MVDSNAADRKVAMATSPDGVETGLSAAMTEGDTFTRWVTRSSRSRREDQRSPVGGALLTAATSIVTPAASASSMSRGPSRSADESSGVARVAASRKRATIGLRRLLMCCTIRSGSGRG